MYIVIRYNGWWTLILRDVERGRVCGRGQWGGEMGERESAVKRGIGEAGRGKIAMIQERRRGRGDTVVGRVGRFQGVVNQLG